MNLTGSIYRLLSYIRHQTTYKLSRNSISHWIWSLRLEMRGEVHFEQNLSTIYQGLVKLASI